MEIFCVIVDYLFGGVITSDVEYVGADLEKAKMAATESEEVWKSNSPHVTIQVWRDGVHVENINQDANEWVNKPVKTETLTPEEVKLKAYLTSFAHLRGLLDNDPTVTHLVAVNSDLKIEEVAAASMNNDNGYMVNLANKQLISLENNIYEGSEVLCIRDEVVIFYQATGKLYK